MSIPGTIIESRLDWLTLTAITQTKRDGLFSLGQELVRLEEGRGEDRKPWQWKSYGGWMTSHVKVGRREDSDIVQLGGALADEWFDILYRFSDHCTRIDLCVTVQTQEQDDGVVKRAEAEALDFKLYHNRKIEIETRKNDGVERTLYLGRGVSDLYARLYDKALESGEPFYQRCWRYEVEVKGEPAQRTANWLHSAGDRPNRVRHAVYQHFARRGVEPIFGSVGGEVYLRATRPTTDTASRLSWLATQVRPALDKLTAAGYGNDALEALGLFRTKDERIRLKWELSRGHHYDPLEDWGIDGSE